MRDCKRCGFELGPEELDDICELCFAEITKASEAETDWWKELDGR